MTAKPASAVGIPFIDFLGVRMEEAGHGSSTLILDLKTEHRNRLGAAHGGVMMSLLDVAMARAARQSARQEVDNDLFVVTIEMKTTFVQAGTGERLISRGNIVHRSSSMCFTEAEVHDESGRLLARASGTFKYVRPRTLSHRPPK